MTQTFLKASAKEPFRIFFNQAIVAGVLGVAPWPLPFWGAMESYPGIPHVRVIVFGSFGGFIFGFLGTALPRMLSAEPLRAWHVLALLLLHAAMIVTYAIGKIMAGDIVLASVLLTFVNCVIPRARSRKDVPPPGFVLVALAFLAVFTGTFLSILEHFREMPLFWIYFQRLLSSQGFLLLPILGIGPFILPRFFGMESSHDFPESPKTPPGWTRKALLALWTGLLV